jgi:nitrate reductase gamma subunit
VSGIFWPIFTFGGVGIFLIVTAYRTFTIIRLPAHLRWELAPIPHEKGKGRYGGSYLEEYEWWHKPQRRSLIATIVYIAREILLLRGVWRHNRALWPLTFSLHAGLYLIIAMLFLQVVNALFIVFELPLTVRDIFQGIASVLAFAGYLLGGLGAVSLIIKRAVDAGLRSFNTVSKYFNLVFLVAVFISGGYAWLYSGDFSYDMSLFIKRLITLESNITLAFPLSLHLVISLLFLIYLPLSDMIHFVAKYFTYHEVRWDDKPLDKKMEKELAGLLSRPVGWSARHVKADGRKSWVDIAEEK